MAFPHTWAEPVEFVVDDSERTYSSLMNLGYG